MNEPIPAAKGRGTSSLSLEEARDRYLDFLLTVKGRCPARAAICKGYLNRLIRSLATRGVTHLQAVTREHLAAYQDEVMLADLAKVTQKEILRVVLLAFQFLHDYGHLETNPALVIDIPRKGRHLPRPVLTAEEFQELLGLASSANLTGLRDRCIFQVLYASAMRPEELCRLTMRDVDLSNRQILIRRPKNRRDRVVHIDRYTAKDMQQYHRRIEAWLGRSRFDKELFFLNAWGDPLTRNSLTSHFWKNYAPKFKERRQKDITLYSLRHSSATDWLDAAAKRRKDILPYVQRQLGHESLDSTAIYTHVAIEPLRQMFKQYHPRELLEASTAKIQASQKPQPFSNDHRTEIPPWPPTFREPRR